VSPKFKPLGSRRSGFVVLHGRTLDQSSERPRPVRAVHLSGAAMFTAIEQHLAAYAREKEEAIVVHVREFIEWARGEEAKIQAEVEHLKAHGYTITAP
jgi:hypothetical protein